MIQTDEEWEIHMKQCKLVTDKQTDVYKAWVRQQRECDETAKQKMSIFPSPNSIF